MNPLQEDIASKWSALVEAVSQELHRSDKNEVLVTSDPLTLQLRARRPLSGARWEWVTVNLKPDEVLRRPITELAKEFARAYYACT